MKQTRIAPLIPLAVALAWMPLSAEASDENADADLQPCTDADLSGSHSVGDNSTFKPGKGLTVSSEDGRFKLSTRLRLQLRYAAYGDHSGDEIERVHGLSLQRARLGFSGHAFNEHNRFKLELAFSPKDMAMSEDVAGQGMVPHHTPILSWYLEFDYLRDLTLRVGQYKVPFSRQSINSSGNLQLVDRSAVHSEFNLNRDIGFDLRSKDLGGLGGRLRYYAGIYMGEGRGVYKASDMHLFYVGRVEVLPFGSFKDHSEGDHKRLRKPRLALGGAYAFVDNAERNKGTVGKHLADGGTTDYHSVTGDFVFKYAGLSALAEFHYRKGTRTAGDNTETTLVLDPNTNTEVETETPVATEAARNGIGWHAQVGYLIPGAPLEIAARYASVRGQGDETSLQGKDEAGLALNWYFARHPLKLQADYHRVWRDQDMAKSGNQFRLQMQFSF